MRQKKFLAAAAALFISLGSPSSHALSKGTFYLELKTGCYSANKIPNKSSKWTDTNYKTLYSTSCTSPHHYEVFFTGKIKAKDLNSDAAKKEAGIACDNAAIAIGLGQTARQAAAAQIAAGDTAAPLTPETDIKGPYEGQGNDDPWGGKTCRYPDPADAVRLCGDPHGL